VGYRNLKDGRQAVKKRSTILFKLIMSLVNEDGFNFSDWIRLNVPCFNRSRLDDERT